MSRIGDFTDGLNLARAAGEYAGRMGQQHPGADALSRTVISPDAQRGFAQQYDAAPEFDQNAVPAYRAMREETKQQFDHLTNHLGVDVQIHRSDPYATAGQMADDVQQNHRLGVLSTASTGAHPFFSDDENDMFRAVHDAFGHAAIRRGFDRHGEEAAYQSHAAMYSPLARQALASETRGQNASFITNGEFPTQKVALLPTGTRGLSVPIHQQSLLRLQAQQFHGQAGLGKL